MMAHCAIACMLGEANHWSIRCCTGEAEKGKACKAVSNVVRPVRPHSVAQNMTTVGYGRQVV
jgi:hypothetical protein